MMQWAKVWDDATQKTWSHSQLCYKFASKTLHLSGLGFPSHKIKLTVCALWSTLISTASEYLSVVIINYNSCWNMKVHTMWNKAVRKLVQYNLSSHGRPPKHQFPWICLLITWSKNIKYMYEYKLYIWIHTAFLLSLSYRIMLNPTYRIQLPLKTAQFIVVVNCLIVLLHYKIQK